MEGGRDWFLGENSSSSETRQEFRWRHEKQPKVLTTFATEKCAQLDFHLARTKTRKRFDE